MISTDKKRLVNFILVLLSLSFSLLLIEGGMRLKLYLLPRDVESSMIKKSEINDLVFELIPGEYDVGGYKYKINSLGFRWREFSVEKLISIYRIIIVGDSIAMGVSVNTEDSFAFKLEKMLNNEMPLSGSPFEVINTGSFYYDIKKELVLLKSRLLAMKPDMVILAVCANDSAFLTDLVTKGSVIKNHYEVSYFGFLYNHSLLWRALYDRLYYIKNFIEGRGDDKRLKDVVNVISGKDFDRYKIYFQQFLDICRENNIKLGVVIFPTRDQVQNKLQSSQPYIADYAEKKGFTTLDIINVFQRYNPEKLYMPNDAVHPNIEGHTIVAQAVYDYVKQFLN